MSLRPPPKAERSSGAFARILFLVLLVIIAGVSIWAVVIEQRIDPTENTSLGDLEVPGATGVDGLSINVEHEGLGALPVILLHDADVSGSVVWEGVIDALGDGVTAVKVDLPGFGLSTRITEPGPAHTVGSMAEVVATIVEQRFRSPVIFAGVGLGGEVAAELAVTRPDLVARLVMIDVDFWADDDWLRIVEKLPFYGRSFAFAMETGGQFAYGNWAPLCEAGGWCPTPAQARGRATAVRLRGTTDSLLAFRATPRASLVPSRLGDIAIPSVYVWSSQGQVSADARDRLVAAITGIQVVESDSWKAHLDAPSDVAAAILGLAG